MDNRWHGGTSTSVWHSVSPIVTTTCIGYAALSHERRRLSPALKKHHRSWPLMTRSFSLGRIAWIATHGRLPRPGSIPRIPVRCRPVAIRPTCRSAHAARSSKPVSAPAGAPGIRTRASSPQRWRRRSARRGKPPRGPRSGSWQPSLAWRNPWCTLFFMTQIWRLTPDQDPGEPWPGAAGCSSAPPASCHHLTERGYTTLPG